MSVLELAIQRCQDYVNRGRTSEEKKIRKKNCQPVIEEARQELKIQKAEEKAHKKALAEAEKQAKKQEKKMQKMQKLMRRAYGDRE